MGGEVMNIRETLCDMGYEDTIVFENYSFDSALIGVSTDGRAIYVYELMVEWLVETQGFEDSLEAIEWIEYNTLRALPYMGEMSPIIIHRLEE